MHTADFCTRYCPAQAQRLQDVTSFATPLLQFFPRTNANIRELFRMNHPADWRVRVDLQNGRSTRTLQSAESMATA